MNTPKAQDPDTVVSSNKENPPLEYLHYMKNGGIWTLKYDISSSKFYGLLVKT